MIAAVIFPRRSNYLDAIVEAIDTRHGPDARLYTDGERLAWLEHPLPGWLRVAALERKDSHVAPAPAAA